jgi:ABC-2 type transport system ATP-binding protein
VVKRYGETVALDGVDLELRAGEVHGLVGPNGAGKSTLLSTLLGLVRPTAGAVEVLGAPAACGRSGVAGFAGTPAFYPYLSGRANLALLQRLDGEHDPVALDDALTRAGLTGAAGSRVAGWSTGLRQRLGLAAALLRRPRLLVLDEPTSGLDPSGVVAVHALLRALREDGTAVLLSSHDLAAVAELSDRVTVLARGRVRFDGTSEQLRAELPPVVHLLSTSDDAAAARVLGVEPGPDGLRLTGPDTDQAVLALAAAGIAVRRLVEAADPVSRAYEELTA